MPLKNSYLVHQSNSTLGFKWFLFLITFLTLTLFTPRITYGKVAQETDCTFSREYITTIEYLRTHPEYSIPEAQMRKLSQKVSQSCTGAAQKFIKITSVLGQSGVSANNAIEVGLEFASRPDHEVEAFVSIFLKAFLPEYLDLDIKSSIKMARSLSSEFQGDVLAVRDDFERLVSFCVNTRDLDLPRPQCGAFAVRIARLGQGFSGGVADSFIHTLQFLRSENGPGLTTAQSLQMAEQLIQGGKDATDNFILAYKYGTSSKGLQMSQQEAIHFAQGLSMPALNH